MLRQYGFLCLLFLFISGYYTQDPTTTLNPDWQGDPAVCIVNPPPTPSPEPPPVFPQFSPTAEFTLERVEIKRVVNLTFPSELSLYQYLYDYNANKLILVKNKNGFIDVEYYYYNILKKSTYYGGQYCTVTDIPQNSDMDGASAIKLPDGSWHIRPLNEFLLFSNENPQQRVVPVYLGKTVVRGIPVDKWQSCYIDRAQYRTVRRIWYFAQQGVSTPTGLVGALAHPVQAEITGSFDFPNGTQIAEVDELYNVISYRPSIIESASQLAPPKGVFCNSGPGQDLISLQDVAGWPERFSVRVEASTSRSEEWQRFHLRYDGGRRGSHKRLRYDYAPPGSEDFVSVIHDYANSLTYTMDRRAGSCYINGTVDIPDVSPTRNPIEFFIKSEARFILNPPEKAWEYNGFRPCRGNAIQCTILTTSMDNFPVMVDIDTGKPTGESWAATNIEYAWSMRAPFGHTFGNRTRRFDYPVTLYLKLFRFADPNQPPSPSNIRSEDVEYEFFEMSHERHPQDFDVSACYRSLGYEYLHLMFVMKLNKGDIIDSNHLDRRELEFFTYFALQNATGVSFSRISEVEIDHERVSNDVTVFFTLLGRTPNPNSPTGFVDEITAATARDNLKNSIDAGKVFFDFPLLDNSTVQFRAEPGTLQGSKMYMSTHAAGPVKTTDKYTSGAEATAIIVGLLIGLVLGVIIAGVVRIVRKEPMPSSISISNPLPPINFRAKKSAPPSNA